MAFNWFNRQYDESSTESKSEEAVPQAQPEAEAPQSASSAVAEDYLTWAKAAYKNIQKRQEVPAADSSETVALETPIAVSESAVTEPVVSLETAEMAEPAEPVTSEAATSAIDPSIIPTEEIQQAEEIQPTEVVPKIEATSQTGANSLPFWAQAEAERQARLERLQEEAIASAEAEVSQSIAATSTSPADDNPNLMLDESFIWSAEVLASQGRRPEQVSIEEITWLKRLRQGLDKTRRSLVNQLRAIVGQGPLNQDAVTEIESLLLQADVGVAATDYVIAALQTKLRSETLPPAEAIAYLKQILRDMLDNPLGKPISPTFAPEKDTLNIWLITGVNGAGKTTTIGKVAHIAQKSGYRTLIAAADTFRAAAVQQVKVWGDRSNVEVIANPGKNTDPAAVVFDAITAAQARNTELLLVDTAGRLQNKKNLMDELSKIRRIIDKKAPDAKIESLLVLDATLGQNGLRQAEVFSEAAQLSGVVLTKLDGTARGGIALAVVQQLGLPIRFIGAGEGIEDLRPFSSYEFIEALLSG
jgi:fused signal recognition particle receptor